MIEVLPPGKTDNKVKRFYLTSGAILPQDTPVTLMTYKEPLEKIEDGYGYYGTLAQNVERTHTQCHICGFFYRGLGRHIYCQHSINAREYKDRFGLMTSRGMSSDKVRERYIRTGTASYEKNKEAFIAVRNSSHRKLVYNEHRPIALEVKNKRGRCYYQLLDKIQDLAKELGRTPTRREYEDRHHAGDFYAIYRTFGTWNKAVHIAGLIPNGYRPGRPEYTYESVVDAIKDFYDVEGRIPVSSDFGDALPSRRVICRLFGGVVLARQAAGLTEGVLVEAR